MVIATTLEFISAQSPQSMKGLLLDVFFAIRRLFQFLNSIIIISLSLKWPWGSGEMIDHPPVTNCGFVYLKVTVMSVTRLIDSVLIGSQEVRIQNRGRGMFHQHDEEEIYEQ